MQFRAPSMLLRAMLLACVCGVTSEAQQSPEDTLKELMEKRRDALKTRVNSIRKRRLVERASFLAKAIDDLIDAEMELVTDKDERAGLLRRRVDSWRDLERKEQARFKNGVSRPDELLLATAERLQAEIDLQRETAGKSKELMEKRRDALKARADAIRKRVESGHERASFLAKAIDDLLDAQIELAADKGQRVDLLRKRVDNLRAIEQKGESAVQAQVGRREKFAVGDGRATASRDRPSTRDRRQIQRTDGATA